MQLRADLRLIVGASDKHQLELLTGRTIRLAMLDQHWTYGGLIAGHPNREMNRHIMDGLVKRQSDPRGGRTAVLLEPIETTVERSSDPSWSDAATLPSVTCIAQFRSAALANDAAGIFSVLRVIWFQDEFAFPIDPGVLVELAALDWEAQAANWEL